MKPVFNFIRNLSLLFVVVFIVSYCLGFDPIKVIRQSAYSLKATSSSVSFGAEANDVNFYSVENPPKLVLSKRRGNAYIIPEEIVCIETSAKKYVNVFLVFSDDPIEVRHKLSDLKGMLQSYGEFVFAKSDIINCKSIVQKETQNYSLDGNNYQNFVIMKNGKKIRVSKDVAKNIDKVLGEIY